MSAVAAAPPRQRPSSRVSTHPSHGAKVYQPVFWSNWHIWKRAFKYSVPFAFIAMWLAYKWQFEWSRPALSFPEALWEGDIPRVEYFFTQNPDLSIDLPVEGDFDGRSPLHLASSGNHTEMVRWLLERGARVDPIDKNGFTPLHYAALKLNPFTADLLISHGADANDQDKNGRTSLHISAIQGDLLTAAVLVYNGEARPGIPDRTGHLALEYAKTLHGGLNGKMARQLVGGKEAAEEILLHRHVPRRKEIGYGEEEEEEEEDPEERRRRKRRERRQAKAAKADSEDPEERTRAKIEAARLLEDFDDEDLPVVRPSVYQINKQNQEHVQKALGDDEEESLGTFSSRKSKSPKKSAVDDFEGEFEL